jgi:hypothetical protein
VQSKYEVDISELVRARKEIKKWQKDNVDAFNVVNQRMQKSGKSTALMFDNMGRAMNTTGKSTNRLGMQMQQVGYQVGDFAVQVQSGTNAMVALGQQGSQLLGVFGPYGALAGMALAIGTAIIAPMMRASEAVEKTEEAFKKLDETVRGLEAKKISLINPEASIELVEASQKRVALSDRLAELNAEMVGLSGEDLALKERLFATLEEELEKETSKYNTTVKRIRKLEEENKLLAQKKALEEKFDRLSQIQKDKLTEINSLTFLNMRYAKDTEAYKQAMVRHELAMYKLSLIREGFEGEALETLVNQKLQILYQTKALEDYNTKAAERLALEEKLMKVNYIAIDPESQLMEMSLKPSKQSGPKKTKTTKGKQDPLKQLMEQLQLERELLGVNQDRAAVLRALGADRNKYSTDSINQAIELVSQIREQNEAYDRQQELADNLQSTFSDAFMSIVDGTSSVKDAVKDMARSIIRQLFEVLVLQQMVGSFNAATGAGTGILGAIMGGSKSNGGAVQGGRTYLVGERGPELFTAPSNGKIHPNESLGEKVVVNQTINVSTGVQQTVRTEIKSLMPQIAEASKAAVADAKRRGGSYGRNFA